MADIRDFWENKHKKEDVVYLSGNKGQYIWEHLCIKDLIKPNSAILNIGVGMGYCTKDLRDIAQEVYAVDISQAALDRVATYVRRSWLAENLNQIPFNQFDLVICFLVVQHMTNKDLAVQLKNIVKTLKPNGIAAYQFAYKLDGVSDTEDNDSIIKAGSMCRHLSDIDKMIREAGGDIVFVKQVAQFPQYGSGWYAVHFKRR